jgi:hypothetical protein
MHFNALSDVLAVADKTLKSPLPCRERVRERVESLIQSR